MNERVDITLTGDDAEWFEECREQVADDRGGRPPGNAELTRRLMEEFEA